MNKIKIEIKWSIIFISVMLLWMIGERLAGLHNENISMHAMYSMFFPIVAIVVYVLALNDKRIKFYNRRMTFIDGFISGMIITGIITLFSPLSQYIVVEFISPEYFQNMIEYSVESGLKTQQAAEEYFNLNSYIVQTVMFTPVMGLVNSAFSAFIIKDRRKKQ